MFVNRRKYFRINKERNPCVVKLGSNESIGTVVDESFDGVRIGGLKLMVLFAGQKITVEDENEKIVGCCRSVIRDQSKTFSVGVQRGAAVLPAAAILLNSFIKISGQDVVCIPLAIVEDEQVRIQLSDGSERKVAREDIFQLTREEREKSLSDNDQLADLMQRYSIPVGPSDAKNRQAVIEHEFGPAL